MENLIFTIGMITLLSGISAHDIRSRTIPDRCNWCLIIWVLTGHLLAFAGGCTEAFEPGMRHSLSAEVRFVDFREGITAAAGMLLFVLAADLLCLRLRGVPVIGGGDLKLLCVAAFTLGFSGACLVLALAVILAAAWIGIRTLTARPVSRTVCHLRSRIPMAPFLSVGIVLTFLGNTS